MVICPAASQAFLTASAASALANSTWAYPLNCWVSLSVPHLMEWILPQSAKASWISSSVTE